MLRRAYFAISVLTAGPFAACLFGTDAVDEAATFIGHPYVWGCKDPNGTYWIGNQALPCNGGLDCTGLVQYAYGKVGVKLTEAQQYLPPNPVVTHTDSRCVNPSNCTLPELISYRILQRGDLLWFDTRITSEYDPANKVTGHVGIYESGTSMIDALSKKYGIRREDLSDAYWTDRFMFAGSVVSTAIPIGTFSLIYSFPFTGTVISDGYPIPTAGDGYGPETALVQGRDGLLYGSTSAVGRLLLPCCSSIFKIDSLGNFTLLHAFSDNSQSAGRLLQAADGYLYGATKGGSSAPYGMLFRVDPAGNFGALHSFGASDGVPAGGLIQARDGYFYGTTSTGGDLNCSDAETGFGSGCGTVFKMDTSGAVTVIYTFSGPDGSTPVGDLIQGSDGNFYGTTKYGGTANQGTVFKLDGQGNLTTLHGFTGRFLCNADGANPMGGVVQGTNGYLYGTTYSGCATQGVTSAGLAFKMDLQGNMTILHSFSGGLDGSGPPAGLIQGSDEGFYGTTAFAGGGGYGTIFRVDSLGRYAVLYSFNGSDGGNVRSGLVQGNDGAFYGTAMTGGANDLGVIYKLTVTVP